MAEHDGEGDLTLEELRVIRRVQALEGRSGDSPVIGGEVRG